MDQIVNQPNDDNIIQDYDEEQSSNQSEQIQYKSRIFVYYMVIVITVIVAITLLIYIYFSFAGIVLLTFNDLIHNFISLFSKDILQIIISIFYILSNFGLTFALSLFCVYLIKDFVSFIIFEFKEELYHLLKKLNQI